MRVTVDRIWDDTTRVLSRNGGAVAGIAVVLMLAPELLRLFPIGADPAAHPGRALLASLIGLVTLLAGLWGQLALTHVGVAEGDARTALRRGAERFGATLGLALVALVVVVLLFVPVGVALNRAGVGMAALALMGLAALPAGTARFVTVYSLSFTLLSLGIGARLCVLYPVVLFERRGLGAYARAWALTRGHGPRLFGVLLLYLVVLLVTTGAVRFVVGALAALVLGAGGAAAVAALVAVALASTALSVVAVLFVARAYVALRDTTDAGAGAGWGAK